jgi:hypothetical protein
MRLLCTCIALFTLACQTPASDAGKAPAKAATPAPAAPPKDMPPKITGNPGGPGDPHAAPTTRAPVNPTEVAPSGTLRPEKIEGLSAQVPSEWTRKPPSNGMRLAEFTLPGPGGEVTMVVSRFPGGGGDTASNVHRWTTQFTKADGSPVDAAKQKTDVRGALTITVVDIVGTNVASVTPGSPERYHEPDSRLLGVIVEGSGDPYFFKLVGPAKTVDVWEPAFRSFADSIAAG